MSRKSVGRLDHTRMEWTAAFTKGFHPRNTAAEVSLHSNGHTHGENIKHKALGGSDTVSLQHLFRPRLLMPQLLINIPV